MGEEKVAVGYVVKFFSVVTLYKSNGQTKVSLDILTKIKKYVVHFGFSTERKRPNIMRLTIQDNKIIFVAQNTRNWRCPKITM
jgi:hypothetical protein